MFSPYSIHVATARLDYWGCQVQVSGSIGGAGGVGSEEAGLAVLFGFDLVVGPASGLEVGVLGGAVVGDGVDVVVLEAPAVAAVDAPPGERRYRSEVQGGAQGGGQVAAEVFDGVNVGPVVQDGFDEGVVGELSGYLDGDGAAADDVAGLAGVGVPAPPGEQVAHHHQVAAAGGPGIAGAGRFAPPTSWARVSAAWASKRSGRAPATPAAPAAPAAPPARAAPAARAARRARSAATSTRRTRGRPVSGGRAPAKRTMPSRVAPVTEVAGLELAGA